MSTNINELFTELKWNTNLRSMSMKCPPKCTINGEINTQYRRFNAVGTQLTVRLLPPHEGEYSNPMSHFIASVPDLFQYALQNCDDSDMVGITISNQKNIQDKAIGMSFRRRDQITPDVI
jgi:hypothetical protein